MKPVIFYGVQEKKYFKMNLHPEVEKNYAINEVFKRCICQYEYLYLTRGI